MTAPKPSAPVAAFVAECCATGRAGRDSPRKGRHSSDFAAAWKRWARKAGQSQQTRRQIARALTAAGFSPPDGRSVRVGIRVRPEWMPTEDAEAEPPPVIHLVPSPADEEKPPPAAEPPPELDVDKPEPPSHLTEAAKSLFRDVVKTFEPSLAELHKLVLACEQLDIATAANAELRRSSLVIDTARGPSAHPAVKIADAATYRYQAIVKSLGLEGR